MERTGASVKVGEGFIHLGRAFGGLAHQLRLELLALVASAVRALDVGDRTRRSRLITVAIAAPPPPRTALGRLTPTTVSAVRVQAAAAFPFPVGTVPTSRAIQLSWS